MASATSLSLEIIVLLSIRVFLNSIDLYRKGQVLTFSKFLVVSNTRSIQIFIELSFSRSKLFDTQITLSTKRFPMFSSVAFIISIFQSRTQHSSFMDDSINEGTIIGPCVFIFIGACLSSTFSKQF